MSSELIFGLFCLVFVVGTFWLSAVFEGRRRDREQKTQQVVEETSDPRAEVRVHGAGSLTAQKHPGRELPLPMLKTHARKELARMKLRGLHPAPHRTERVQEHAAEGT